MPNGWYGLAAVDEENMQNLADERKPPVACPNDGETLQRNPRTGELQCPYDGFIYRSV